MKPKKIGLALGGGGARGLAHIGVIKTLIENGIEISFIAGTSIGALVGGWYAATGDIDSLERLFFNNEKGEILNLTKTLKRVGGGSVQLKDHIINNFLGDGLAGKKIEDCKIPFRAIATDIKTGDEVVIKEGNVLEAIRASSALPIVFSPVSFNDKLMIDGGFSNPVPADVVKQSDVDYIIAVDVSSQWLDFSQKITGWTNLPLLISNVLTAAECQLSKERLKSADIILRPTVLNFSWFDYDRPAEIIRAGISETKLNLKKIFEGSGFSEPPRTPFEKFLDFIFDQE